MITPLVIELVRTDAADWVKFREGPCVLSRRIPNSRLDVRPEHLRLDGPALQSGGAVRRCGQHLYSEVARNENVHASLQYLLGAQVGQQIPIYLEVDAPDVEDFPWETIWHQELAFLALKANAAVARLPSSMNNTPGRRRTIEPTPTVAAVIAPSRDVDVAGEWNALYSAFEKDDDRVRIHVITSRTRLRDEIEALADPRLSCALLEKSPAVLIRAIGAFRPNIVHFFCHGTGGPDASLELSTRSNEVVKVDHKSLEELAGVETLWLVVLNCCNGGQSSREAQALARRVANCGVPAVVAMRREVLFSDAARFCRGFYAGIVGPLLTALPPRNAPSGTVRTLDEGLFLNALCAGRQEVHVDGSAEDQPAWTFPVLYLHRPSLTLWTAHDVGRPKDVQAIKLASGLESVKSVIAAIEADDESRVGSMSHLKELERALEQALRARTGSEHDHEDDPDGRDDG